MKKNKRWIIGFTIFLMMAVSFPITVFARGAVDTDRDASLTVNCTYDENPLSGVAFDLYKVADMDAYGEFTVTDDFSGYAISLDQQTAEEWRALAQTIASYAIRDNLPVLLQETTDSSGHAAFTGLRAGMYLVYGHRYINGDFVYTPEPFLVSLPGLDNNDDWLYDVETNCKGEGHTDLPMTTTVKVLKVWEDAGHESNRPRDIEVQLLRDDLVYDTVTLNAENNWRYTWQDLSTDYQWSVIEKDVPENYTLLITREGITFVLTNTYNPTFTTVVVEKIWNDPGHENSRPREIEVQLLRDGQVYDTVVLNESCNWRYAWSGLEEGHDWSVKEQSIPAGYAAIITQTGGTYTITNTYTPPTPDEPHLPQTGQLWWPIPVLLSAGLMCYLIGFLLRKAGKKRDA